DDMAVGKGAEKAEIDSQRRHVLAATLSPRGEKRRTAEGENVLEIMSVLIGDAVAVRAGAHGLQQADARRLLHVVPRRGAESPRIGARDGLEGEFRVGAGETLEN